MKEHATIATAVWNEWILDAVIKIRSQKQRPSEDRIFHAIRQHHKFSDKEISPQLNRCVAEGVVLKVINKGKHSYKDPSCVSARHLKIDENTDLTKIIIKAIHELNDCGNSSIEDIEKYIRGSNQLCIAPDLDFCSCLKSTIKVALTRGFISEGENGYIVSEDTAAGSSGTKNKSNVGARKKHPVKSKVRIRCFNRCNIYLYM